ncbi:MULTISPECIES: UDP-N-acetylmuramoyl-L-alanyl-D-glutamate--2,6-diaminopimelate ligase [unclassified Moraxella]|uniref:UDP-N-acetylmuramoyl-L-alanyl-D-glutamate--2, 6-diaminopimelate ligase n=1 Tax=unclassified Moraxella TaxID=2685852 RepID=UPI003AF949A1
MQLHQFNLSQTLQTKLQSVANLEFDQFAIDSRKVTNGNAFILLKSQNPNAKTDMATLQGYLDQVKDKAVFVLSELDVSAIANHYNFPIVTIVNIRDMLGDIIAQSLQLADPIKLPTIIATTGTNGKTTVSQLVAQLVSHAGNKTAIMGTAGNGLIDANGLPVLTPATHTTMEVFNLHHAVYDFAKQNVQVLSIEASSHGLHQQRLQGLPIQVAIYSNLSRDHLDYHTDMDDYANAKARLFDKAYFLSLTHAIINLDDEFSALMINTAKQSGVTVWTYSLMDNTADFFAKNIAPSLNGVDLTIATPQGDLTVKSPLLGRFNVANLLASIAGAVAMGVSLEQLQVAVPNLKGATGRMDRVASKVGAFIVDYAHTPDALEQVLTSLRPHCEGNLWAVFGCGGDRDKGKRPLMAQVALKLADKVILTADNPRTEDPNDILNDMQSGMSCEQHEKAEIEADRKTAINMAVQHAKPNDIVVIAGKGHETYQEINGIRHDFDDKQVVAEAIAKFNK